MRLLFCLMLLLLPLTATAASLTGDTVWRGSKVIKEAVRVEPGATLRIEPGSRIEFQGVGLEIAGRLLAREAILTGGDWPGVTLKGVGSDTLLVDGEISGAQTGLTVGGGAPRIEGVTFRDNRVGLELRQKSDATVSGCLFRANQRVGLFVKDGSTAGVVDNRFENNGKYGAYLYRSMPRRFTGNMFNGNPTGIMISHYGTDPELVENCLTGNGTAIMVDKAARPVLRRNDLRDNEIGLHCQRRADAAVTGNRISANRTGVLISLSSYPELHGNDLSENGTAIRLDHQSLAWERELGAATRDEEAGKGAFGAKPRQEIGEVERRTRREDATIDARQNWWGERGTSELAAIGAAGNPSFIDDGRDQALFEDGGRQWPLDRVNFSPWTDVPPAWEKE